MPFDYDTLAGLLNFKKDSKAIQNYKAGAGAFAYTPRQAGWTEEQIANGMRSHFESTAAVLAEHIRGRHVEAAAEIDPQSNPCGRDYCTACHPETN